jgi:hypothetical protein
MLPTQKAVSAPPHCHCCHLCEQQKAKKENLADNMIAMSMITISVKEI